MATYFGEVVFPPSRAFWDDDEDEELDENSENTSEISIRWLKDKPTCMKKLIFIEGETIIGMVKECLCQNVDEACIVDDELSKKIAVGYKINESTFLYIISTKFNAKHSGEFIEKISDLLSIAESTASITCQHVSYFKGANVPRGQDCLRILCSQKGSDAYKEKKKLEQPNIISGVTAGVLSHAEITNQPSVLHVLYTDGFALDSQSTDLFRKLLSDLTDIPLDEVTFTGQNFFTKGNLYM